MTDLLKHQAKNVHNAESTFTLLDKIISILTYILKIHLKTKYVHWRAV